MKTSIYLYGVDSSQLPAMEAGLTARIDKAKHLLDVLLSVPLQDRDWARITAVANSITHNSKLLNGGI